MSGKTLGQIGYEAFQAARWPVEPTAWTHSAVDRARPAWETAMQAVKVAVLGELADAASPAAEDGGAAEITRLTSGEHPAIYARWVRSDYPDATDAKVARLWKSVSEADRQFWAQIVTERREDRAELETRPGAATGSKGSARTSGSSSPTCSPPSPSADRATAPASARSRSPGGASAPDWKIHREPMQMNNAIGDALARDWNTVVRDWKAVAQHGQNANPQPQESRMTSRIADARAAIDHAAQQLAAVPQNALADAIADEGAGLSFGAAEISLVLAVIHGIEHGPGGQLIAAEGQRPAQQQAPAGLLQPQQAV